MKQLILIITLIFAFAGCKTPSKTVAQEPKGLKMSNATPNIYSCELIEKEFYNKSGKATGIRELYLRCSVQDYFIKICESNVTRKELEPYLDKGITVEVEIKEGLWDHCSDNVAEVQSRMGSYIIIKSIK